VALGCRLHCWALWVVTCSSNPTTKVFYGYGESIVQFPPLYNPEYGQAEDQPPFLAANYARAKWPEARLTVQLTDGAAC